MFARWLERPSRRRMAPWLAVVAAVTLVCAGACQVQAVDDDDGAGGAGAGTTAAGGGDPSSGGAGPGGAGSGGALSCNAPEPGCDPRAERGCDPELLIGPTGLQDRLVALMDSAQSEILLMMYQLTCNPCINGLINAHNRGVTVRVLLDYEQYSNDGAIQALTNAGVDVSAAPSKFNHNHAKVMVIDRQQAVVMSANMNIYSMSSERNYGVIDRDAQDIEQLVAIFEGDANGGAPVDTSCTRLIVSPENARPRILELIESAQQSLDLAVMYISDYDILDAVKAKAAQGVPVRVLLAHPEWIDSNPGTAQELSAAGVQTKYLYAWELHAKLVVADGVALVGSENMSYNSLENNREVGLLVTEPGPAGQIDQQFEQDWSQGVPAP